MLLHQEIIEKEFNGYKLYKVNDVLSGSVVNSRAVKEVDGKYELLLKPNKKEEEFMTNQNQRLLFAGPNREKILEPLRVQEQATANNIMKVLSLTANIDMERTDVRIVAGHVYVIALNELAPEVPQIQYVFGDEEGKIAYHGPVFNDEGIIYSIIMGVVNNPYFKEGPSIFQITGHDYLTITENNGVTVAVPLMLQEEKDGTISWVSNTDLMLYVEKDDDSGELVISENSQTAFKSIKEAQSFLSVQSKELTDLLLLGE